MIAKVAVEIFNWKLYRYLTYIFVWWNKVINDEINQCLTIIFRYIDGFDGFDGFDHNYDLLCGYPRPNFFGKFQHHSKKLSPTDVARKIKTEVYNTIYLIYFNRKRSWVNWIWYPCCLFLIAQYLRRSYEFLRRFIKLTHNFKHTSNAKFQNHWSFVIVCQKHSS